MTDCSCIAVYVDEGSEFCSTSTPRARVVHKCCECERAILPGELYERAVNKYQGDLATSKTCLDCVSIREAFFCEGWYYGQIWEHLHEHLHDLVRGGEIPQASCMLSLTKAARDQICDLIEELWADDDEDDE